MKNDNLRLPENDEMLIVELDERLEFSVMRPDSNWIACNDCQGCVHFTGNCVAGCGGG